MPFFSYSPKTTSINFPWPPEVSGIERIVLSAQGGLQRVLSAFFAQPISIALVYSSTHITPFSSSQPPPPLVLPDPAAFASASPSAPIIQTRQVHLRCANKTICTATSTVRVASPLCARLFLEEKYAIGQMFTRLEKMPDFELVAVGFGEVGKSNAPILPHDKADAHAYAQTEVSGGSPGLGEDFDTNSCSEMQQDPSTSSFAPQKQLWRRYRLAVSDFECDILEVFPDRDMFILAEKWLEPAAIVETPKIVEDADDGALNDKKERMDNPFNSKSGSRPASVPCPISPTFTTHSRLTRFSEMSLVNINLYLLLGFLFLVALEVSFFLDGRRYGHYFAA